MSRIVSVLTALLVACGLALAADQTAEAPVAAPYPFDTCIVSGEPVGEEDKPLVLVHEGRQLKFCCGGCRKRFLKDPVEFLRIVDAGIAAKAAGQTAVNPAAVPAAPASAATK